MATLLRIDSSARTEGSRSRALGDHFQRRWLEAHPEGRVIVRDLARDPVPHPTDATFAAFAGGSETARDAAALSDALVDELRSADRILVTCPTYNFNVPSPLKAYVDHVVRAGRTFGAGPQGYFGLLTGRSACVVTVRGGRRRDGDDDAQDLCGRYLATVFRFLGVDHVDRIEAEGTSGEPPEVERELARARDAIDRLADLDARNAAEGARRLGALSARDLEEIDALRRRQVAAILDGDALAYAGLCTDDVLLMLQGRPSVQGREAFVACESELLRATRFRSLRQIPSRLERQGDLAVEAGRQEVELEHGARAAVDFKSERKYVHVLRRTPEGWRFAVLTSNNSL